MIQAFDTRNPTASFMEYHRPGDTNQRLQFDVDPWGRWLASGDEVRFLIAGGNDLADRTRLDMYGFGI